MRTLVILLTALLLACCAGDWAKAQEQVTPGYQVCNTNDPGNTHCSWQPVDVTHGLPVTVGGTGPGSGSQPYNYTAVAGAQYGLTIASSTALTVPATALQTQVCVSGNSIKYTYDGTTPTASVGLPLQAGQCIQFSGAALLAALRFIQTAATATLDVGYTK